MQRIPTVPNFKFKTNEKCVEKYFLMNFIHNYSIRGCLQIPLEPV